MTEWLRPSSLAEALEARAAHPTWLLLAGGTDVMVGQAERPEPAGVIDLFGLPELTGIRYEEETVVTVRIGAATTYAALQASPIVRADYPLLAACAREVGALQIQARGTIGGNVGTSSPVGDTLPALLALDATLELASVRGVRRLPYEDFLVGYRKTALAPDELLTAIRLSMRPPHQHWRKVGTRRAQSISKVMLAATASVESATGTITSARVALGAVADRPIRVREAEQVLTGSTLRPELAERARDAVIAAIRPITDVRSTAEYRSAVAGNLVRRFVLDLFPDD